MTSKPANTKFKITTVIRQILLQDSDLTELIEDKIFPLYAPDGTEGDYVLYARDEYSIKRSQMGIATQKCQIYINVVSEDYDRGQDIAEKIFNMLEGKFSDGMKIHLEDSTEDIADKKYVQVLLFSIE
jgi:hypothetical protein